MKEHTNKTITELVKIIADKREALRVFRFGNAGSKSKNVKEGRGLRKEIAQVMTELSARRNAKKAEKAAAPAK